MNKGKFSVHNKLDKKMQKEVRRRVARPAQVRKDEEELTRQEMLKKFPKKDQNKKKALLASIQKAIQNKKRTHAKVSKRTTPGMVDHKESSPAHAHREGEKWAKTLVKQNVTKQKALSKKLSKR